MSKIITALAVIHFAGEHETYAFKIVGPEDGPESASGELSRFMDLINRRIEDVDPFTLQLMAIGIFEGYRNEVTCNQDMTLAEATREMDRAEVSQLLTL